VRIFLVDLIILEKTSELKEAEISFPFGVILSRSTTHFIHRKNPWPLVNFVTIFYGFPWALNCEIQKY
jgi:hypothetical protein